MISFNLASIGSRIRQARCKRSLTQQELGKLWVRASNLSARGRPVEPNRLSLLLLIWEWSCR